MVSLSGDDVTLAIALWGAATGTTSLYLSRSDSRWKRRHASLEPLRNAVEELSVPVRNSTDPQVVRSLFSVTSGAHIETLRAGTDQVPDRLCRRQLRGVVAALTAFRGAMQPDTAVGSPAALTKAQLESLREARVKLEKLETRLNTAARKGKS
jgi:hypothetical protein